MMYITDVTFLDYNHKKNLIWIDVFDNNDFVNELQCKTNSIIIL